MRRAKTRRTGVFDNDLKMTTPPTASPFKRNLVKPFLKWPGGKRWLTRPIIELLKERTFGTYFEPFLGGGALFFALSPKRAILSDLNGDLINTYVQVKNRPHQLTRLLKEIPVNKQIYDNFRSLTPPGRVDRAVQFLYLNRTAFGGMYRLNRKGRFNVPFGGGQRTPAPLWDAGLLRNAAKTLKNAELRTADFQAALDEAKSGDLVYCDPTYTVSHNNNGFVRYNEENFRWKDQERLADTCKRLCHQGVTVLVSNADHADVVNLYAATRILRLDRVSSLCPKINNRKMTKELLLFFDPEGRRTRYL
jgi:DNA adenine methylase